MFAEMEGMFLPEPTIDAGHRSFKVVLRNTPTLTVGDRNFVSSLGPVELADQEFRALLEAHRHGRVDNARLRSLTGLDTLSASRLLVRLRDRGLLALHGAGSASFYTLVSPPESTDRGEFGADRGEFGADRGEFDGDRGELPDEIRRELDKLGSRPRAARLRPLIVRLCTIRPWKPADLAAVLGFKRPDLLVERHLKRLCEAGDLARTHPETPNHPEQAYRATGASPD